MVDYRFLFWCLGLLALREWKLMKVGDLVQYGDRYVEQDVGLVFRAWTATQGGMEVRLVDVLWKEGDVVTHYARDFTVISEGSYENR